MSTDVYSVSHSMIMGQVWLSGVKIISFYSEMIEGNLILTEKSHILAERLAIMEHHTQKFFIWFYITDYITHR